MKEKFPRIATLLFIVLGCMILFQACSADECSSSPDITNVNLTVDSDIMCEDHVLTTCFHSWTGLQAQTNGFWVFFEDDVVNAGLTKDCIDIWYDGSAVTHPYNIDIYSDLSSIPFRPAEAEWAVKIWVNESIPHNKDVCIRFRCLDIPCPLDDCNGFRVWVNNDIQRCPQVSCPFYMKVKVEASAGPDGTIEQTFPAGPITPPNFTTIYNCGDAPTYHISTTAPCYEIDQIIITPLCDCTGCGETITYGNGTTEADYQFDPLDCSYNITATFKPGEYRVKAYLKYQLPKDECWGVEKRELICEGCDIQSVLDCVDTYYLEHGEPYAWQMVTQNYLECNTTWEGYIGVVVEVAEGTYNEDVVVDTPGVHLKPADGASPVIDGSVSLLAGCTGIEGFTITNSDTNGIYVHPSSDKCANATIFDSYLEPACCDTLDCENYTVPCCFGRINIVNNEIFSNDENGIYVEDAVVLIRDNAIYLNGDDGIDAGCLFSGVECIDPEAITHHTPVASEIIYNTIYGNGPSGNGEWEVYNSTDGKMYFTSDPKGGCEKLPGWTDAGIQIRCVGSYCPCPSCCDCDPTAGDCDEIDGQQVRQWVCGEGCNQTLYIVGNDISQNFHAGIYLMKNATQGGYLIIQENRIHENGIFGMLTEADKPCRIDFRWNDIWCNTYWGVKNLACCDLIAKENYWGSAGGPSAGPEPIVELIDCRCHEIDQQSDALGNGNAVSHRVHYNPWLYSPWTCLDGSCSPVRMYGSDSLLLQCGWNTLSVPVMLADEGDTMWEIAHLGNFITGENFVWILRWDAVTDTWVDVGAGNETIAPGYGYYIKMLDESKFPVLYNAGPSPGLVAVPLQSGWNLIGSPWGIDREDGCCDPEDEGRWAVASPDLGDSEAFKPVWEALESIKEGNGGTKGVAIIVSPSVPGQYEIWSASVTSGFWDPIYNNKEMATGDAYWVFMVNPSTYAGFEITPFYFPTL